MVSKVQMRRLAEAASDYRTAKFAHEEGQKRHNFGGCICPQTIPAKEAAAQRLLDLCAKVL